MNKHLSDQYLRRLVIRERTQTRVLDVADIEWIAAADYYSRVHCAAASYLIRQSLTRLLAQLDPAVFVRVHRSAVVNIDHIRLVLAHEQPAIVLKSGKRVPLGRRQRTRLAQSLGARSRPT
jgi:two-component system, LytTR family, response regulator